MRGIDAALMGAMTSSMATPIPGLGHGTDYLPSKGLSQKQEAAAAERAFAKAEQPALKDTNPKDAIGCDKVPFSTVPAQVIAEIGLAMLEGCKYGRHNYRIAGVRSSIYYDAAFRHITAWWEGQDIDPASGLNHVTKALASLTVLRDAMLNDMLYDDRPPPVKNQSWVEDFNAKAKEILQRLAGKMLPPYTRSSNGRHSS